MVPFVVCGMVIVDRCSVDVGSGSVVPYLLYAFYVLSVGAAIRVRSPSTRIGSSLSALHWCSAYAIGPFVRATFHATVTRVANDCGVATGVTASVISVLIRCQVRSTLFGFYTYAIGLRSTRLCSITAAGQAVLFCVSRIMATLCIVTYFTVIAKWFWPIINDQLRISQLGRVHIGALGACTVAGVIMFVNFGCVVRYIVLVWRKGGSPV